MTKRGPVERPPLDRFLDKLSVTADGCWRWLGAPGSHGYGQLNVGGDGRSVIVLAHRFSYELFVGPIPPGLQLDHLCRNRLCVNPDHLEPVTNAENGRRGLAADVNGRRMRGIACCKRGHELPNPNDRGRRVCKECGRAKTAAYRARKEGV